MNINKLTLYGNLTKDPVLSSRKSGEPVCNFTVATHRKADMIDGIKVITDYHHIVAHGSLAEKICKHRKKGQPVYIEARVEGKYQTNKEKERKYVMENNAQIVQWPVKEQEV